jgi:hypothetical protein
MLKHAPRKVLTQPRSKHEVSPQNGSTEQEHRTLKLNSGKINFDPGAKDITIRN